MGNLERSIAESSCTWEPQPCCVEGCADDTMIRLLWKMREAGFSDEMLRPYAIQANAERFVPPLDESELERLIENACKFPIGKPDPVATIGGKAAGAPKAPVDWRTRYMTAEQYENVKPPESLIDGFLVKKSIAMLGGPVAQRKSIIALHVAHALCTGEPLFG